MTQPVKSADRTLEILEVLAAGGPRTLGDLARDLGIPKSSLHGILRTIAQRGWIETDPTGTRFGLGLTALRVGAAYLDTDDVVALLGAALDELSATFGETVHLGRLDGADVVYVAKRESKHPLRLYSAIGRHLPAHATALGKALLAGLPPAAVGAALPGVLPRLTANTITDLPALHAELGAVRARGYAVDNGENTEGIVCVARALPLSDPPADAISVSIPQSRVGPDTVAAVAAALETAVDRVTAASGLLR
ncbi:IclR family transcriptional regulator [Dactylosporangium sp. NPDC005572]|uniref:IclR family transcriptional regulator n=1 Tax=Dactylosporangium sp. NPDC005572 TaxID=3156889 RepID=UPI0033B99E2C